MFGLPLAFVSPVLLSALVILPALYLLLRLVPPQPQKIAFPPLRLLLQIEPKDETPSRSPWWLTALRLLLAGLVIILSAGPIWNPPPQTGSGKGPLLVIIDDSWAAAPAFDRRIRAAEDLIAGAESASRPLALLPISRGAIDLSLLSAGEARDTLRAMQPQPFLPDRRLVLPSLKRFFETQSDADIAYLSDGLSLGPDRAFLSEVKALAGARSFTLFADGLPEPLALKAPDNASDGFKVTLLRASQGEARTGSVRALDKSGLALGEMPFILKTGESETQLRFDLPVELRNEIARLDIAGEASAGAVQLIDARWKRRTVAVVSGGTNDVNQPLLSPTYYLAKALEPFADIRTAEGVAPSEAAMRFAEAKVPMIVLTDVGTLTSEAKARLTRFIEEGGVLLRFAGPRLAGAGDDLSPVRLRRGGRQMGGALSWEQPKPLAPFGHDGLFADLPTSDDVLVKRQVLAEPDATLADKTWAQLNDGTPLVTGEKRGLGTLVLFHVTADTSWSNLPISGLFVEMLKRIAALSQARHEAKTTAEAIGQPRASDLIAPNKVLDGYGRFAPPPSTAKPIAADRQGPSSAENPPGFYGAQEALVAVNALAADSTLVPLERNVAGLTFETYRAGDPLDLRAPLLMLAVLLILADAIAVMILSGAMGRLRLRPRLGMIIALIALSGLPVLSSRTKADPASDKIAVEALNGTRIAYIVTGDREIDEISSAGLEGLTRFLTSRTALEPGTPAGIDLEKDELTFYAVLFWPVSPRAMEPSPKALLKLDAYMKQGGMVVFDTRDSVSGKGATTPAQLALRRILAGLDIPDLEPAPRDHVLGKAFYLLKDFPGRFSSSALWVEALPPPADDETSRPVRAADGVSPLMITGNDLLGAWAIDRSGGPLLPMDGDTRQREMAFRVGVNIMMYALTGNYKSDQVHVPALLERLGN